MRTDEKIEEVPKTKRGPDVVGVEGSGIFLSYQLFIFLVGGLVTLGSMIAVWDSYGNDLVYVKSEVEKVEVEIETNYDKLYDLVKSSNKDINKTINNKFEVIERRIDKNHKRINDHIEQHDVEIQELREQLWELKYTKADKQ